MKKKRNIKQHIQEKRNRNSTIISCKSTKSGPGSCLQAEMITKPKRKNKEKIKSAEKIRRNAFIRLNLISFCTVHGDAVALLLHSSSPDWGT